MYIGSAKKYITIKMCIASFSVAIVNCGCTEWLRVCLLNKATLILHLHA